MGRPERTAAVAAAAVAAAAVTVATTVVEGLTNHHATNEAGRGASCDASTAAVATVAVCQCEVEQRTSAGGLRLWGGRRTRAIVSRVVTRRHGGARTAATLHNDRLAWHAAIATLHDLPRHAALHDDDVRLGTSVEEAAG